MKRFLYPLLILCSTTVLGQSSNTEEVIRKVADNVIQNTSFKFINTNTKEKYDSTKGLASSPDIKADSKYNKWMYVNGVLTIGMVQMADVLGDKKYSDYSQRNFAFIFDNLGYFEALRKAKVPKVEYGAVFSISNLDACGAMSAGLFDVDALANRKDYKAYLSRSADYILNKQLRLPDGTLSRPVPRNMTLWADDMFMSIPFLARMGKQTGDSKYFDDAIKQVENFNKYLYDPNTGLFFHNYYSDDQTNGVGHWGRSNGWIAMATVELLNNLPANHPKRAEIIKLLLRQIVGYARYQDQTGLWHQLLDKPDSYLETSVTAMYTYAVARAVNQGWINEKYIAIAQEGWKGLLTKVTVDGQLQDVCIGTNMDTDIKFYYTRPTELNDTHGTGAFLLAGTEMLKAERKK
ncbi:Rhamnogalacturonyl hydrolase YesR [Mucilaginibacter lappiensis]|uniref:Rhamnogalacturonyl hydrolase YesR n=1 Tax=Mucilaginibacter lappiensis TaxID=354630 RepID=A0ABR6PD19_9SPHI|nr:glycoside hydrolase family 88 protein [Mucilaginibacter lappiensis]MBB6107503.1 rhamnogalacturonyl hydrolase YesR [Mucilaginibacter lappiensis]SIQ06365.1 Rhamnogalacturonyl hydrolase YesR [Mucilaginibacter lappiensis]